ncbi:MAG: hypothetical protein LWW94_09565 [Candidatus Desulfofervidaceae bacterium]|nr:hypothetical protein [Candidatus Desulfofervidaceae bacterium]
MKRSVIMAITEHKTESISLRYNSIDRAELAINKLEKALKQENDICSQYTPVHSEGKPNT